MTAIQCSLSFILSMCLTFSFAYKEKAHHARQTNLLLIMYDDLRPELSIYGKSHMITPNFERLAKESVVFDYAISQLAVCNPSRDSLLTGLRPDTVGTYAFQSSYHPHIILPTQLSRSGYNTAGYGKIRHWDGPDSNVWSFDEWENDWYGYQGRENMHMNSTAMPDKVQPEENFRDHEFTTRTVEALRKLSQRPEYFMAAIGFKLPHLALHVPYKYFDMYRDKAENFKLTKRELRYPSSSPEIAYRCCAEHAFNYMNNEGAEKSKESVYLGDFIDQVIPEQMHTELLWAYSAGISFLDVQLGRLLDALDELKLWENTTIILSSDHGMHHGEKGIWEKWTTFDESSRVPLIIHHPQSPNKGKRYRAPVELIDIYPTALDLTGAPFDFKSVCEKGESCLPLQGKSLAPVVLGDELMKSVTERNRKTKNYRVVRPTTGSLVSVEVSKSIYPKKERRALKDREGGLRGFFSSGFSRHHRESSQNQTNPSDYLPNLEHTFGVTQTWRCAPKDYVQREKNARLEAVKSPTGRYKRESNKWVACDNNIGSEQAEREVSVMGYSMRTEHFRYTAWIHFDRKTYTPDLNSPPMEEELYDHRAESLADFTHKETANIARRPGNEDILSKLRDQLIDFLKTKVVYKGRV